MPGMSQALYMPETTLSVFLGGARDNVVAPQVVDIHQFLTGLQEPEIFELRPGETMRDAKERLPAWNASTYSAPTRSKKACTGASMLVFDMDEGADGLKEGLEPETLQDLFAVLDELNCVYAVHSTPSSGLYHPRQKVRIILPLTESVTADEYVKLWDKYSALMPAAADVSRRGADGIFFVPACLTEHREHYICRVQLAKPYLKVRDSKFGKTNLNLLPTGSMDVYQTVTFAKEKHNALNRASFILGKDAAAAGKDLHDASAEAWVRLEAALRANVVSKPVEDWEGAHYTHQQAFRQGFDAFDPEEAPKAPVAQGNDRARKVARKVLEKQEKRVRKNVSELSDAAFEVGGYVPHVLAYDTAFAALLGAWRASKEVVLSQPEAEACIAEGLAEGGKHPKGALGHWADDLVMNKEGGYANSEENVYAVLEQHPDMQGVISWDLRAGAHMLLRQPPWDTNATRFPARFDEQTDPFAAAKWTRDVLRCQTVGSDLALKCVYGVSHKKSIDRFEDYLAGLAWDGVKRLDTWLIDCAGAEDTEYVRLVGAKWLISAVARTRKPGSKVDTALILVGKQGLGKSKLFSQIVPDASFTTDCIEIDNKDSHRTMERFVIIELAELSQLNRKDVEKVKHFITMTGSNSRNAYARAETDHPRRCVLAGTTNRLEGFLNDTTGGRRFWPVNVSETDEARILADRDQLWAEAVCRFNEGEVWWLVGGENKLAQESQMDAMEEHPQAQELAMILHKVPTDLVKPIEMRPSFLDDNSRALYVYPGQMDGQVPKYVTTTQVCDLMQLDKSKPRAASDLLLLIGWRPLKPGREFGVKQTRWAKE
jgi:Virulence-associated protein E